MADAKISPHSLSDLKNTTDDALGNYCRSLPGFQQDNTKLDVRLALGYVSVLIAAAIFAADYKLGWEATKQWTAVAVAAYAVLNMAFTYWMWGVERGVVCEGRTGEGKKISMASKTKKHDCTYYLTITREAGTKQVQIQAPFTTWFTADGYFVTKPFQEWLAKNVDGLNKKKK